MSTSSRTQVLTAEIVSAHARGNKLDADALPPLILAVGQAFAGLGKPAADYPMAAPNYSARRTEMAKLSGLGRRK